MALSSSGSISLSQIQTEYGGSNPIGLNEYYIGSLQGNVSSPSLTATVISNTTSVYNPGNKLIPAYTTYYYSNGWKNNNIPLGSHSVTGSSQSATVTKYTGVDHVGNAGQIPSSGAIQFNHFRGTNKAAPTTYTCYGILHARSAGGTYPGGSLTMWLAGHWGPNNQGGIFGGSWTGVPFTYMTTAAEGTMPASNWGGSTNIAANNANQGYQAKQHETWPNIGNVTKFQWLSNGAWSGFSGTWQATFHF